MDLIQKQKKKVEILRMESALEEMYLQIMQLEENMKRVQEAISHQESEINRKKQEMV
jgi:hypothetical protein